MDYSIDRGKLYLLIFEETSRVAASAYTEDGGSLYDNIVLTSADGNEIERLEDDAVNTLVKRTADICKPGSGSLRFDVPDFDASLTDITSQEITRYIVLNTCSAWFQSRYPAKAEEYAARGQVAMDKAVTYLKTIKPPKR